MMNIYFVENEIWIVDKDKVINKKLNSINLGRINNRELFIEEFNDLLKSNHIKGNILGNKIKIVKNTYFNLSDLYFLKQLFIDLGFLKIAFIDIKDFYLNKKDIYLEINNEYIVFNENIYNIDDVGNLKVFLSLILPSNSNIILYGNNELIPKLKLKNKNIYYVDNYNSFIIDSVKNM